MASLTEDAVGGHAPSSDRRSAIRFIVCLGLVSLFADMTYEGAYSGLGPLLKDLGAGAFAVGLISGIAEMIAASLRFVSGRIADRTRAYWTITIAGYVLNLLSIPALAFAASWPAVALLVAIERMGKAMRGPARDVLLSEATETVGHGWGFGLHTAMDQTGAVAGPLIVTAVVVARHQFAPAFIVLAIPAALALGALFVARAFRHVPTVAPASKPPRALPPVFWWYVAAAGLLACGYVDFTLLAFHFRATAILSEANIPLCYAIAMGVEGLSAFAFGRLFDRWGVAALAVGILASMAALPLGFFGGATGAFAGVCCWALGLGVQDASLRSGIAQVVSMNKRGTAFGAFNLVFGVMWFIGSAAMGWCYAHGWIHLVVALGLGFQGAAVGTFLALRGPLARTAG